MNTFSLRKEDVTHRWYVVDAAGQPLGRLASRVAQVLRGKHKPTFTPHINGGDCVIVVNAEQVKLSGRKMEQKRYFRHTGYMGQQPFTATDTLGAFDVRALVRGGGLTGQAGSLRLGIGRALVLADERHRKKLREQGLLTRDPRVVERKKPGRAGARKRFQFSKR